MIRVEVKGQTLEFPDGTSDELIDKVVKRDFFAPAAVKPPAIAATPKAAPQPAFYPVGAPTWLPAEPPPLPKFKGDKHPYLAAAANVPIAVADFAKSPQGAVTAGLGGMGGLVTKGIGAGFGALGLYDLAGPIPEALGTAYGGQGTEMEKATALMAVPAAAAQTALGVGASGIRKAAIHKLMNRPGVTAAATPGAPAPPPGAVPTMSPEQIQAAIDAANAQLQKTPEGLAVEPPKTPPPAPAPAPITPESKGEPNAVQNLTPVQKESIVGGDEIKPNQIQTGTQTEPRVSGKAASDDAAAISRRNEEATNAWLEGVSGNDTKAILDAEEKLFGPQMATRPGQFKVLGGVDTGGKAIRTPGSHGEIDPTKVESERARSPQERGRVGQPTGEFGSDVGISPHEGTPQPLTGSVGEAIQQLRDVSRPDEAARGARTLRKVLSEKISLQAKNQILKEVYATIRQRKSAALSLDETPRDSAKMVEGVPPPEEAAVPKEAPPLPPPRPQDAGVRDVAPITPEAPKPAEPPSPVEVQKPTNQSPIPATPPSTVRELTPKQAKVFDDRIAALEASKAPALKRIEEAKTKHGRLLLDRDKAHADRNYDEQRALQTPLNDAEIEVNKAEAAYNQINRDIYMQRWYKQIEPYKGVEAKLSKPKITNKIAKAQKENLMSQVDAAIKEAPEENLEKITFDVPGDGSFTIENSKDVLKRFRALADKKFPKTGTPKPREAAEVSAESSSPASVGMKDEDVPKLVGSFVSDDDARFAITTAYADGTQIVATDGRQLIRIVTDKAPGTPAEPVRIDPNGEPNPKAATESNYPNFKTILTGNRDLVYGGMDTESVFHIAKQAKVFRDTTLEKDKRNTAGVELFVNPDRSIGGKMEIQGESFTHNVQPDAKRLGSYNPDYIINAVQAARKLGNHTVDVYFMGDEGPMVFRGLNHESVTMPMRAETGAVRDKASSFASIAGKKQYGDLPEGFGPLENPDITRSRVVPVEQVGKFNVILQDKEIRIEQLKEQKGSAPYRVELGKIKLEDWPEGNKSSLALIRPTLQEAKIPNIPAAIGPIQRGINELVKEREAVLKEAEQRKTHVVPTPKPGIISGTATEASAKSRMKARISKSKKMGIQPGENPFNDPKVLSDLVIIGVGALERGARDFAAWSKEMLAHDPNLAPHLPNLFAVTQGFYKQHVQQGLPVAGTAPTPSPAAPTGPPPPGTPPQTFQAPPGPGAPTPPPGAPPGNVPAAGFPAPGGAIPPATAIGVAPNSTWYRSNWFKADRWLDELGKYYKRRFDHAWKDIPQMLDAGDNIAHNEGRQARIMMELRYQPHELDAMTFAAQSFEQGAPQLALLDRFEQDIANAPQGYPPDLIERALKAVRYAKQHVTDKNFMDGVQMLRDRFDSQWSYEKRNGINTDYRDNYINQMWDFDIMIDPRQSVVFGRGKHYGPSSSFRKDRTFNDYAEGIRAGYAYKTLNAAELLENRVRQGSIVVGRRQWFNMWKGVTDPVTKTPIVRNMIPEIDPATGKLTGWKLPDHGMYKLFTPHGNKVGFGVHEGWDSMFHRLLDPSRADESVWRSEALRLAAGLKHNLLLLDTYHGFRILYSTVAAAPKAQLEGLTRYGESSAKSFYFRGLSALEYRDADLAVAQTKGLLTPEEVTWIRQVRPDVDMLMKNGLNAARFSAAMYDRLKTVGIITKYTRPVNRYIFEKFSRGAMVQTALSEFQRLNEANPTVARSVIAKQVARDVNVLFGNIQRQGIFQSAGARDLLHAVFLAPQWNEALIRRDIMGTAQLAGFGPKELQRGGIAQGGTLGKTLATGLLAHIFLNQILNYVTRGHSTFENTEPGQKLSAWIPDVMGGSPGYFFSPTAVFGEATGELNDLVRRKGTIPEAVSQYLENKFGPGGKFLHVLATGQDYDGLARNFGHRLGKAANALIPMPIPLSGVLSERPGSMQKQAMSAAGLRTSFAPTAVQEIQELVKEWKRATKDDSRGLWQPFDDDPYKQMHDALRNNNKADFAKAYGVALDRYPKQQVNESMRRWSVAPFAGTQQKENAFKKTLTPDQLQRYDQAKEEKRSAFRRFQEFRDLVR